MAKPATIKIKLLSTADTGFFYVTKKNPRNITEKMTFRKYDPVVRKHVEFKETHALVVDFTGRTACTFKRKGQLYTAKMTLKAPEPFHRPS